MLGEIVSAPRNSGQLGAYVGPHVRELPVFRTGEMFGTFKTLSDTWRIEYKVLQGESPLSAILQVIYSEAICEQINLSSTQLAFTLMQI